MRGITQAIAERAVEAAGNVDPSEREAVAAALQAAMDGLEVDSALPLHARQVSERSGDAFLATHAAVTRALDELDPPGAHARLVDNSTIAGVIIRGNAFVEHEYKHEHEIGHGLRLAGSVAEGLLRPDAAPPIDLTALARAQAPSLTADLIASQWQLPGARPESEEGLSASPHRYYIGAGYAQRPHTHVDPVFLAFAFGPSIAAGDAGLSKSAFLERVEAWIDHCHAAASHDRGPIGLRAAVRVMAAKRESDTFLSDSKFIASKAWDKACDGIEAHEGVNQIRIVHAARFLCGRYVAQAE